MKYNYNRNFVTDIGGIPICYHCAQPGHLANLCPSIGGGYIQIRMAQQSNPICKYIYNRNSFTGIGGVPICYYCAQQGHLAHLCPRRIGGGYNAKIFIGNLPMDIQQPGGPLMVNKIN